MQKQKVYHKSIGTKHKKIIRKCTEKNGIKTGRVVRQVNEENRSSPIVLDEDENNQ
jgi:hypothetical protein